MDRDLRLRSRKDILAAALCGMAWLWWTYQAVTLLTVGSLGLLAGAVVLSATFPHIIRLVRYKKTFRDVGLRGLLGVALALGFKFHRRFLDRLPPAWAALLG